MALVGWDAMSLVPGRAGKHSLCAAPSSEVNTGTDCGSPLWPRLQSSCGWQGWLWLLLFSEETFWDLLVALFCPWEEVLIKGITLGA